MDKFPGLTQAIASLTMREFEGIEPRDVEITGRGDETLRWGMPLTAESNKVAATSGGAHSDPDLDVHGANLRIKRLLHALDFQKRGPKQFQTTVVCRPRSLLTCPQNLIQFLG